MFQERNCFENLYSRFSSPITEIDCGGFCSVLNETGKPFCCDITHSVPTAFHSEYEYLKVHTNLWRNLESDDVENYPEIIKQLPDGQRALVCLGHQQCVRKYRTITCRTFPFFPYIAKNNDFLGLSYYWEYEDRCWVINNLEVVTINFREEFVSLYVFLFNKYPSEWESFSAYSGEMRNEFSKMHRAIPLLHRNGYFYKISPISERMRRVKSYDFPKYHEYKIIAEMPFPDE